MHVCVLQTVSVDADYIDFLQRTRSLSRSPQARAAFALKRAGSQSQHRTHHPHLCPIYSQQSSSVLSPISALAAQRSSTPKRVRGPRTAAYIRKHKAERKATRESLKREMLRVRELAARAIQISWRRYTCARD